MLKEIDQTGKFMTLIEADFRGADFICKNPIIYCNFS